MAEDIQIITGTKAIVAARLCNFGTGYDTLLWTHQDWLDKNVQPAIQKLTRPWVEIHGYASHRGDARHYDNQGLSIRRCQHTRNWITNYANNVDFKIVQAVGSSQSTGGVENDDGYWRAVEVYVYAENPEAPKPPEQRQEGSTEFEIQLVKGTSVTIPFVGLAQDDSYEFRIIDRKNHGAALFMYQAFGFSVPNPIPTFPPGFTVSTEGPPTPFRTSTPVLLLDFDGAADLGQDPTFDKVGGKLRVTLRSNRLTAKNAIVIPSILGVEGGNPMDRSSKKAIQVSTPSISSGLFKFISNVPWR